MPAVVSDREDSHIVASRPRRQLKLTDRLTDTNNAERPAIPSQRMAVERHHAEEAACIHQGDDVLPHTENTEISAASVLPEASSLPLVQTAPKAALKRPRPTVTDVTDEDEEPDQEEISRGAGEPSASVEM